MEQTATQPQQKSDTEKKTFGQKSVGISFNPSNDNGVDRIKQICANAIDEMNNFRNEIKNSQNEASTSDAEKIRLASIAITELQGAQMWCVKAITWKD